jgi:L-rhamnose mutarotase
MMKIGSLIKLRPEYEERYIILHKHTFPGVLERIRKSQIRNYSIFLRDGILFSYYEYVGDNFDQDMARIGEDAVTQDWWKLTDPMQEPLETRKEGEWWASMEEIFHRSGKDAPGEKRKRIALTAGISSHPKDRLVASLKIAYPVLAETADLENVGRFSVFHISSGLYSYFEFFDEDARTDIRRLQENLKVEDELDWMPMKEVFHTD